MHYLNGINQNDTTGWLEPFPDVNRKLKDIDTFYFVCFYRAPDAAFPGVPSGTDIIFRTRTMIGIIMSKLAVSEMGVAS